VQWTDGKKSPVPLTLPEKKRSVDLKKDGGAIPLSTVALSPGKGSSLAKDAEEEPVKVTIVETATVEIRSH